MTPGKEGFLHIVAVNTTPNIPSTRERNLSLQAYEHIHAAILEGQYPPSYMLREVDLVREYAMSRTPIREALHRLDAQGLIRQVAPGSYVAIELGPKQLADIYQVREALGALSAQLAANNRTRIDLAHIEDTLESLERVFAQKHDDDADTLVRSFWHAIATASGNDYLRNIFVRATDLFRYKGLAAAYPQWRQMLIAQHRDVLEALRARDAQGAERAARAIFSKGLWIRISELRRASGGAEELLAGGPEGSRVDEA